MKRMGVGVSRSQEGARYGTGVPHPDYREIKDNEPERALCLFYLALAITIFSIKKEQGKMLKPGRKGDDAQSRKARMQPGTQQMGPIRCFSLRISQHMKHGLYHVHIIVYFFRDGIKVVALQI